MVDLLDELNIDSGETKEISFDTEFASQWGPSTQRLLDRQGLLLAAIAQRLAKRNSFSVDTEIGLYCVLEIPAHDAEVAKICAAPGVSLANVFENEIRPTRVLQSMPIAQVFWSALAIHAEGPVRVFSQSEFAEQVAAEQAALDLDSETVDAAIVLSVRLDPEKVRGQVFTRKGRTT